MFDISEPIVQLLGVGLTEQGSASLTGESSLVSAAVIVNVAAAGLSAESDVSAAMILVAAGSASLSGSLDINASAVLVLQADSSLSAEGNLIAGLKQTWSGSADLSAEVTLSAATNVVALAASIVVGASNLSADLIRLRFATARNMDLEVVGTFIVSIGHPVRGRDFRASSSLTATIYTNPRLLVLPTVEYAYTDHVLLERYPIDNGQALLITNGVGELLDFPAQQLIADADYYFGGGRRNELTPEEEAAVVAAGYGEYIETEFLS